jgi:hypothetical protein
MYMIKTLWTLILIFGVSAFLFSGCVSQNTLSNPSVQTGAGIGVVTGAIIGGNVGDRSGSNIAGAAVLGATIGGAIGNATGDSRPQQTGGWE